MDLQAEINLFIERHFRWGDGGKPSDPGESDARRQSVESWIEGQTFPYHAVTLTLIARLQPVLERFKQEMPRVEGVRLVRVDPQHMVKRPESVLEKLVRQEDLANPLISFDSLRDITDLGRFRIVVNFLSGARQLKGQIEETWSHSGPQQEFIMVGSFEDCIHVKPRNRNTGERCFKGRFHPKSGDYRDCKVEVQIQTLFQEAWDKKDHCLIYEPRRRGVKVEPEHELETFAMSELLYVADLTFDRIRNHVLRQSPEREKK